MITRKQEQQLRLKAIDIIKKSNFPVSEKEFENIAVADFGLSRPIEFGAQILTLFETSRISAKLIVLLPGQILPEHWHPPVGEDPGKEEIIRGYWGAVEYYGPNETTDSDTIKTTQGEGYFTVFQRTDLLPSFQIIIPPGTKHWLKGGPEGGLVISFSTCVRDILDQFTDPEIIRTTKIIDD